jgi:hypothetical protein
MADHCLLKRTALTLVLALPLALAGVTACGGSKGDSVTKAQVKPGDMPAEGEWTGVYYSQLFGHLHMVKDGSAIIGRWRTAAGDKWGELHGEAVGDVVRFEWKEHRIGMVGPNATSNGRGYFRYVVPEGENVEHEIHGEWGLGASDSGNPWDAIKQRRQAPDLDSVMPDETQRIEDKGWDQGSPRSESSDTDSWD